MLSKKQLSMICDGKYIFGFLAEQEVWIKKKNEVNCTIYTNLIVQKLIVQIVALINAEHI